MKRSYAAAIVALAVLTTFGAQAATAATKTLTVESQTPIDGATVSPTSSLSLSVDSAQASSLWSDPYPPSLMSVDVASNPALGQDGTLAREFTIGSGSLTRGDAFPSRFSGSAFTYSQLGPGTYYWQAYFTKVEDAPPPVYSEMNTYATPVFRFVVAAPVPPAPVPTRPGADGFDDDTSDGDDFDLTAFSLAEARTQLPSILRKKFRSRFKRASLRRSCRHYTDVKVRCRVSWTKRPFRYSGNVTMRLDPKDPKNTILYTTNVHRKRIKAKRPAPREPAHPAPPRRSCDPNYSGCLDPNAYDYDCAGGSGDGPRYTGEVRVYGNDRFDLDRDGDGVACDT